MASEFAFVTCQVGAERAIKTELARRWPGFRLAYSRPGFLTFKLPDNHGLVGDFDLESTFARAYGFSLGKVTGDGPEDLVRGVWDVLAGRPVRRIHCWPRDAARPGEHGFEPTLSRAAFEAHEAIRRRCPRADMLADDAGDMEAPGRTGEFVLDCVLAEPREWWVGYHRVKSVASRWPGGMLRLEMPPDTVSRAWLKMEEALRWSELPIPAGARCAEIGSAPGGASQALLGRGFAVVGIDPAEMDPAVLAHPDFKHIRRRAMHVPRREFRKIRWLTSDMNVAPHYTCDVVEAIVTHPEVHVRGMLLTLKLLEPDHADRVPEYVERICGWGYNVVRARQLQHNRQEVCVAALQKPFLRKSLGGRAPRSDSH